MKTPLWYRAGIVFCWLIIGVVVITVERPEVPATLALYVWLAIFVLVCWSLFAFRKLWNAVPRVIRRTVVLGVAVVLAHLAATIAIIATKGWSPEGLVYGLWVATYVLVAVSAFIAPALLIVALTLAR